MTVTVRTQFKANVNQTPQWRRRNIHGTIYINKATVWTTYVLYMRKKRVCGCIAYGARSMPEKPVRFSQYMHNSFHFRSPTNQPINK